MKNFMSSRFYRGISNYFTQKARLNQGNLAMGILLALALFITSCSKLTESNFKKIQNGMTTDEVKAILGSPIVFEERNSYLSRQPSPDAPDYQDYLASKLKNKITYFYHTSSSDIKIIFLGEKVTATEGTFK